MTFATRIPGLIARLAVAGLAAFALAACGGEAEPLPTGEAAEQEPLPEIKFSILATESSQTLRPLWAPYLADMREQTGLEITPYFASDYAGIIEALRFGQVNLGWFSNKSGLEAVRRAEAEVFAKSTYADGRPGYYSIILVPSDSPIQNLDDLLVCDGSIDFGLGDPNSTSGTLVPQAYVFAPRNIDPAACFGIITNASHEANAVAVANGVLDAATNNTTNILRLERARPEVLADIREIWRSPLIQSDPIIWRHDLHPEAKRRLLSFFMRYGRQGDPDQIRRERAILFELDFGPFLPSSNAHFYPIRQLELIRDMAHARNDSRLSDDERAQRIAELQATIDALTAEAEELPAR